MRKEGEKEESLYILCSVLVIVAFAVFFFLLRYDVPLHSDDIKVLVINDPDNQYLDNSVVNGECELDLDYSIGATWRRLGQTYFTWDGRVIGRTVTSLIRMIYTLPDGINWIVFSIYIMLVQLILILITVQTIFGRLRTAVRHPMMILLTAVVIYIIPSYSYAYVSNLIMHLFTDIYVLSVILYLAYYGVIRRIFGLSERRRAEGVGLQKEEHSVNKSVITVKALIGINILGLLAGLSHEAYGVIFGTVLLTQLIKFWWSRHRRISVRYLFMYIGYVIGYCICFFAPGNFNRAQQSHEEGLRTVSLFHRMWNSMYIHLFVAYKMWIIPVVVIPLLIICIVILFKKKILTVKDVMSAILNNLEWVAGFAMSVIAWGLVAIVARYGMLAANVILLIGVSRVLYELWCCVSERIMWQKNIIVKMRKILAVCSIVIVFVLFAENYSELMEVHHVASTWREQIYLARRDGLEEIKVPPYPVDIMNPKFYKVDHINRQENYDKISYRLIFGTHIVIDDNLDANTYNGVD